MLLRCQQSQHLMNMLNSLLRSLYITNISTNSRHNDAELNNQKADSAGKIKLNRCDASAREGPQYTALFYQVTLPPQTTGGLLASHAATTGSESNHNFISTTSWVPMTAFSRLVVRKTNRVTQYAQYHIRARDFKRGTCCYQDHSPARAIRTDFLNKRRVKPKKDGDVKILPHRWYSSIPHQQISFHVRGRDRAVGIEY
jgi:hypothetical protein